MDRSDAARGGRSQPGRRTEAWPPGSFLARLGPQDREELLGLGTTRRYPPRTVLLQEGEPTSHLIVIRQGRVKVTASTKEGHEVLLAMRTTGDVVGELAAMDDEPRSATVTTCGNVLCDEVGRDRFRSYLRTHPEASRIAASIVGGKLRTANRRRLELTAYPVRIRVARVLSEFARSYGRRAAGGSLVVQLTQGELAELAGAAVVSAHGALRELRERNLIDTRYGKIIIFDPDALEAIARSS